MRQKCSLPSLPPSHDGVCVHNLQLSAPLSACTETPVQGILEIVNSCLKGILPPVHRLVTTKDALHRSVDIYRPIATRIQEEMGKAQFVDVSTLLRS